MIGSNNTQVYICGWDFIKQVENAVVVVIC